MEAGTRELFNQGTKNDGMEEQDGKSRKRDSGDALVRKAEEDTRSILGDSPIRPGTPELVSAEKTVKLESIPLPGSRPAPEKPPEGEPAPALPKEPDPEKTVQEVVEEGVEAEVVVL